jgi:DNA-binding MarR family transcriptional regulator
MDAGALAHTLKPLERDGLVSVEVDREDRRNRVVRLTTAGRTRLAESDLPWESAQRAFEAAFGRVKSEALRETMRFLVSGEFIRAFQKATSKAQTS